LAGEAAPQLLAVGPQIATVEVIAAK